MIEVFKTDVRDQDHANVLLDCLHETFAGHTASFDLEDCEKILRVEHKNGLVEASLVIDLLNQYGFIAEVLPGDESIDSMALLRCYLLPS
ncbi:hypothetical protein ACFSUS_07220 [Spirosoma soli]|uniref:Uncharacterized protein n=1 Tax=Spirosoma soli TaxID=1770529 RepID=A0ABW5M2P7_9BACT